jgi:hypothetical protein
MKVKLYIVVKDIIFGHLLGQINKCLVIDTTQPKGKRVYFSSACWFVNDKSFTEIKV